MRVQSRHPRTKPLVPISSHSQILSSQSQAISFPSQVLPSGVISTETPIPRGEILQISSSKSQVPELARGNLENHRRLSASFFHSLFL